MSLVSLNPVCLWRQREFADFLEGGEPPAGTPLAKHLTRCEPCRAARAELRRLSFALTEAVAAPPASGPLVQAMWKQIDESERKQPIRVRSRNYAFPMITAALFFLGIGALLRSAQEMHSAAHVSLGLPVAAAAKAAGQVKAASPIPEIAGAKIDTTLSKKPAATQVAALDVLPASTLAAGVQRQSREVSRHPRSQETDKVARRTRNSLDLGAAVRERQEAAGSGLVRALQAVVTRDQQSVGSRDPNVAFTAGQTAENAGDTEQAVTDYVSALHEDANARSGQTGPAPG